MMYILDTDHISLAQRQDDRVLANLSRVPLSEIVITAISVAEQLQGRLSAIRRASDEVEASRRFRYLIQTVEYLSALRVLPYDDLSAASFMRLRSEGVRVGTQDLRIASIALRNSAVVVTRNRRDFGKIPGLQLQDWSVT